MSELKACPFCGFDTLTQEGELVICLNCGATHGDLHWQSRPLEDALRARAETAEAEVKKMREALTLLQSHCHQLWTVIEDDEGWHYLEYGSDKRVNHAAIMKQVEEALK